ncbi:MAG: Fe-S cluster assembly protein SufB [Parcubacteria group bacterium]|nr:Fe-S cluster assembly protein SufB [Parcubacteria group bacterium]
MTKDQSKKLSPELIRHISALKKEPKWMLEKRLTAYELYQKTTLPTWGPDLSGLDFENMSYFTAPGSKETTSWDEVPSEIRETFEKLGIPEAEKHALSGAGAQYDSGVVYHHLKESLKAQGVIFENMDTALEKYPEMVKEYFMTTCVPAHDHKFTMLHAALWSGGTFIYVPHGVKVELPLQAYFRMNKEASAQFEHTLIIADEGSEVSYIEGCSAPSYTRSSLHAGCVELFVKKGAKMKYISVENWSKNTYNLNTKRALVFEDAEIQWINGNMGGAVTMLYPSSVLLGKRAKSDSLSIVLAASGQIQDTGAKAVHVASDTVSTIRSKSISTKGGTAVYRGLVRVLPKTENARSSVSCDSLILDNESSADTYPSIKDESQTADISHEARVGRLGDDELFYIKSRGFSEENAVRLAVGGFIEPIVKALPLEYAVEMNKLIEMSV